MKAIPCKGKFARRLRVAPECLVMMCSRPEAWKVSKDGLPRDAQLVGPYDLFDHDPVSVDSHAYGGVTLHHTISLWITSSAFKADDPIDLPDVYCKAVRPDNGEDISLGYAWCEGEKEEPAKSSIADEKPVKFREFT